MFLILIFWFCLHLMILKYLKMSKLNRQEVQAIFKQLDKDQDGKLNAEEMKKGLTAMSLDPIYIGTLKKYILMMNSENEQANKLIVNFEQYWEFVSYYRNPLQFEVWKVITDMKNFKTKLQKEINENKKEKLRHIYRQLESHIRIKVGDKKQYQNRINIKFNKHSQYTPNQKTEVKIWLSLIDQSQCQTLIEGLKNQLLPFLQDMMEEQDEMKEIFDGIKFSFHEKGQGLEIVLEYQNGLFYMFQKVMYEFFDVINNSEEFSLDLDLEYAFDANLLKLVKKQIPLFDVFSRDCYLDWRFNSGEIINGLRRLFKIFAVFDSLQVDKLHPAGLLLFLMNNQVLNGQFELERLQNNPQVPIFQMIQTTKQELMQMVSNIVLQYTENLSSLKSLLKNLGSKIDINVCLGSLQAQTKIVLKELPSIITRGFQNLDEEGSSDSS